MPIGRTMPRALCALTVTVALAAASPSYAAAAPSLATAAELRALTAVPAVVTVATAPATVALSAHVVAPDAADTVTVTLGQATVPLRLTGGTLADGTWSGVVSIPAHTPYGPLDARIDVADAAGAVTTTLSPAAVTVADATPAAPATIAATGTPGTVRVVWAPPPANGTSPVTAYDVTAAPVDGAAPAEATVGADAREAAFAGLAEGRYVVRVAARNATGPGPAATADATTQQGTTQPAMPTSLAATPGDGTLAVAWTPAPDGGSAIDGYDVTATPRADALSVTATTTEPSATLGGLRNGVAYDVTVVARSAAGTSLAATTTATPRAAPAAPAITAVQPRDGAATVTWTAPDDGGAPVESYAVIAGGLVVTVPGSARSVTVRRLPNGVAATFTVAATNAAGTGPASNAASATPRMPGRLEVVTEPAAAVTYRTESVVGAQLTVGDIGLPGERVELLARPRPSTTWRVVAAGTTGSGGRVTLRTTLPATSALKLRHVPSAVSATEVAVRGVTVASRVTALASAGRVRLGQPLTVRGYVAPAHPVGSAVRLQRYSDGAWRTIASGRMTTTTAYRVTWRANALGARLMRVVKPADADHATGVSARWTQRVDPENAADHARAILADGSIRLERVHVSGISDLANARQNVADVAAGRLARRSSYQNAPGGYTALDVRLLRALRRMGALGSVTVSEIAGGSHARNSSHYYGRGLDISYVNGRHVAPGSGYRMAVDACRAYGAVRVFSPGYDPYGGHHNHVHCDW